jgi:quinol monooxygenase YgiN
MSQSVYVTFVMNLKPDVTQGVCSAIAQALPDTRAFPGCRGVRVLRNEVDPNKILLLQEWDSREDHEKYWAWRNRDGTMDGLANMLTTPTQPEYWPIVIA